MSEADVTIHYGADNYADERSGEVAVPGMDDLIPYASKAEFLAIMEDVYNVLHPARERRLELNCYQVSSETPRLPDSEPIMGADDEFETRWCWNDLDTHESSQEFMTREEAIKARQDDELEWFNCR